MGEQTYKAIKLFKIVIFLFLASSLISICFHTFLIVDDDLKGSGFQRMITNQGQRLYDDENIIIYAVLAGSLIFIVAVTLLGLYITLGVLMILSSKEIQRNKGDRTVGGILVLFSVFCGLIGLATFHRGFLYGGFSLFIRKQLPEKYRKKNLLAFLLVTTGRLIITASWIFYFLLHVSGLTPLLGIFSGLLTTSGLIVYLIILDRNDELPIPPPRKGPRLRQLPKIKRKSTKLEM